MAEKIKIDTVDAYVASLPAEMQKGMKQFRTLVKRLVPGVTEKISYQMPAFEYKGILVWFAAWKSHYGLYPYPAALKTFSKELSQYKSSKGAVQFPADQPLPLKLLTEIIKYRLQENLSKSKLAVKKATKKVAVKKKKS